MPTRRFGLIGLACAALLLAACGRGGNAEETPPPSVTAPPTATTTAPPATPTPADDEIEADVRDAYLAYWDAYSEAVLQLDASLVEGYAGQDQIALLEDEIDDLRANGFALRVAVEHDIGVVLLSEVEAGVFDRIVNNSFHVDAVTKEPPEGTGSGEVLDYRFRLELVDGRWIVMSGFREAPN